MKRLLPILALALPLSAQTPVLIGHAANTLISPTTSAVNTTGANFYAVCAASGYAGIGANPVSDSLGNTYTLAKGQQEDGDVGAYLLVSFAPTTGSAVTWTGNSGAGVLTINAMAFSNIASGPDQVASTVYSGSTGSVTPTNADELILACLAMNAPVTTAVTVNSPMILGDTNLLVGGGASGASAYQIQTTATTINPTFANITATAEAGVTASFYSAASPAPLVITTTAVPEGFVSTVYTSTGSAYSNQFTATGGVQPYVWTVSSGTLPAGLSLSTGGWLTGTPTGAVSARSITYEVTDANSTTATVTLPITVAATALSITVGTCTLTGTQYTAYGGCQLNAVGGTSPYSFPNNANHNPEGFEINSSGTISGTMYGMGGYGVVFLVTDSLGTTAAAPGYTYFSIAGNSTTAGCLPWAGTIFNYDISSLPVDTSVAAPISSAYTSSPLQVYGGSTPDDGFNGIPFMTVPYNQALVAITGGLYFSNGPWPWYATVEFSSDHHSILVQTPGGGNSCQEWDLWEAAQLFTVPPYTNGSWSSQGQAFFTLTPTGLMLPQDYATADAAGLPLAPLIANYDEVAAGAIQHPIRFTLHGTLARHIWPATSQAGGGACTGGYEDDNKLILQPGSPGGGPPTGGCSGGPMGEIYRISAATAASLAASYPCLVNASTNPQGSVFFTAFQHYGIILADNGSTGSFNITPDSRWNDADLACVGNITLAAFEPVNVQSVIKTLSTVPDPTTGNSDINLPNVSYEVTGTPQAVTPTFSPAAGAVSNPTTVTASTATTGDGCIIYFDTNEPPTTAQTTYSVTVPVTLYAQAKGCSTHSDSGVGSAAYTITLASTPTCTPSAGTYIGTQSVTCSSATPSSTTYCTIDGSTPTTGSPVCTSISVATSLTLKAISAAAGYSNSAILSQGYTINGAATPTFSPVASAYVGAQSVTLATATSACTSYLVWNTTNAQSGGNLTGTSSTNPLTVSSSETVYAQVQSCPGYPNSAISNAPYVITVPPSGIQILGTVKIVGAGPIQIQQ